METPNPAILCAPAGDGAALPAGEAIGPDPALSRRHLREELMRLDRWLAPRSTCRSEMPGVARFEGGRERGPFWMAYFSDPALGKKVSKRFSIKLNGEDGARTLATEWRLKAVEGLVSRRAMILQMLGTSNDD